MLHSIVYVLYVLVLLLTLHLSPNPLSFFLFYITYLFAINSV